MSLKRKASFPRFASPERAQDCTAWPMMDDSPKHLNSRTRKRVRNDRPDDQVVYEHTLRWLFTAQQRQQQMELSTADIDGAEDMEIEPANETIDPRQRSLLQFFRPTRPSPPISHPKQIKHLSADTPQANDNLPQHSHVDVVSPIALMGSSKITVPPQVTDAGIDMGIVSGMDESSQATQQWLGSGGCDVLVNA